MIEKETRRPERSSGSSAPRGDRAFELLYRDTRDDLYSYLAYLLGDASLAEEVAAQAFERAFRKRHTFDARRGDIRAWLFRIARNAGIDELRRGNRQSVLDIALVDPRLAAGPDRADDRIDVVAALRDLAPRQRELVALKFFAGLGNREIARVLGQSESNVGSQLHRAIAKLREALDA
ncbi:MAG: RNA polymerase sigma factor [Solirubrobacterales bacterium]